MENNFPKLIALMHDKKMASLEGNGLCVHLPNQITLHISTFSNDHNELSVLMRCENNEEERSRQIFSVFDVGLRCGNEIALITKRLHSQTEESVEMQNSRTFTMYSTVNNEEKSLLKSNTIFIQLNVEKFLRLVFTPESNTIKLFSHCYAENFTPSKNFATFSLNPMASNMVGINLDSSTDEQIGC